MACALLGLAACRQITPEVVLPGKVVIEPVITRATEVNFEEGDAVGVGIVKSNGEKYAENTKLTYTGGAFSGELEWYGDGGLTSSISAYYPYSSNGFPSTFTVGSDQTSGAGAYDLMVAAKADVKPQTAPVTMVFKHQLTQIVMNVTNTAGVEIEKVVFKGVVPTVNVSVSEFGDVLASVDTAAEKVDIVAEAVKKDLKYRAIIAPQTLAFGVSLTTKQGGSVLGQISEVTMKPGYSYAINAEVTAEGVRFSLAGEIEAWEDGGTLDSEKPTEPGFEEGDGYFNYGGLRYATVKLADGKTWMAEPLAYVPKGMTVTDDPTTGDVWFPYSSDGAVATALKDEASIKAKGYLYSYNALLGTEVNESNWDKLEGVQGICPEGWHIPTRAEWFALCGTSNASALLGESGTQTNDKAYMWDPVLGYSSVGKFNEAGFNFVLSGCIASQKYNTLIVNSSVSDLEALYGQNRMAYYACSSPNKSTQFFALMTTFTSVNAKGKVSLAFATLGKTGVQVRCVKE